MYIRINALNWPAADEVYLDYCRAQAQYDSELTQKSQEVQRLQSAGAAGFGKYQLMEQQMVRQAWSPAKRTGHAAADLPRVLCVVQHRRLSAWPGWPR